MEVFCILTSIGDVDYEKHLSEVKIHLMCAVITLTYLIESK